MTVSVTTTKVLYQGNGTTTQWDIPFPFLSKDDLQIFCIDSTGASQRITEDFSVNESLKTLTYPLQTNGQTPLAVGSKLLIMRATPLVQETAFARQDTLDPDILEKAYDKAMLISQELTEQIERCIKLEADDESGETNINHYVAQLRENMTKAISAANQAQASAAQAASGQSLVQSALDSLQQAVSSVQTTRSDMRTEVQSALSSKADSDLSNVSSLDEDSVLTTLLDAKADTSLSNLTTTGEAVVPHLSMPGSTRTALTVGASGSTYTAPADGYFYAQGKGAASSTNTHTYIELKTQTQGVSQGVYGASAYGYKVYIPVLKGTEVTLDYQASVTNLSLVFIYAKGAN